MKILHALTAIVIFFNSFIFSSDYLNVGGGFLYNAWSEKESVQLLKLDIRSEKTSSLHEHPLQIIFCLDASQQMAGNPLTMAKKAVIHSLSKLSSEDMISIISYTEHPKVTLQLRQFIGNAAKLAERSVSLIKQGNNRDLSLTIDKIEEQLSRYGNTKKAYTYVILISNGNPNKGITDQEKLLQRIIDLSVKHNMHFTTIGYDKYFNENFMIECATQTGGNAYLIEKDNIDQIIEIVAKEVTLIKSIAYKNIYVDINLPPEVKISNIYGAIWRDNKIFIPNLQPNYLKPIIIKLHGNPTRSRDIPVEVNFSSMCNFQKNSVREYIDLQVYPENRGYNKKSAPSILVYSILHDLAVSMNDFKKGKLSRNECAIKLSRNLYVMEQTKIKLHSAYFDWCFYILQAILFAIRNEAIEDKLVVKIINYSLYIYLAGYQMR